MLANELQASLTCECGKTLVARAKDAGGSIQCSCGRSIAVPKLSEMRRSAGADAYVTNPAEAIRKAQHEGNDPAGTCCVQCQSSSARMYVCNAICESSYFKQPQSGGDSSLWRLLFMPFLYEMALAWRNRGRPEDSGHRGHDVEVAFNLPVCDSCAATVGNVTRPRIAKKLMLNVPAYRELLAYYPSIKLRVERPE